jgi:DNA invertase Pin-like site-specific DNA recombinase
MAEPLPHLPATKGSAGGQSVALQEALRPLLQRVGGQVVQAEPRPGDVPVEWRGEVLFHVRLAEPASGGELVGPDLTDGLARLIEDVEAELGGRLSELPRAEKQHAVRMLEERGAFEMRRSAETVAEALGVTRFTVYNYLNRARGA